MWISLTILFLIGVIISKPFRDGILTCIGSAIVFTPLIVLGTPYTLFISAPYLAYKSKNWGDIPYIYYRSLLGIYAFIGDTLQQGFAMRYDELGNVLGGELLEDLIGAKEMTCFGLIRITVSASIGEYLAKGWNLNSFGVTLVATLNFGFNQSSHALGAWQKLLAIREIEAQNLLGKKK